MGVCQAFSNTHSRTSYLRTRPTRRKNYPQKRSCPEQFQAELTDPSSQPAGKHASKSITNPDYLVVDRLVNKQHNLSPACEAISIALLPLKASLSPRQITSVDETTPGITIPHAFYSLERLSCLSRGTHQALLKTRSKH